MSSDLNIEAVGRPYGALEAGDREELTALVDEAIDPECGAFSVRYEIETRATAMAAAEAVA